MRKILLLAIAYVAPSAFAQVWIETGDAPDGVPDHQVTVGDGALTSITGAINRSQGDHVDTYCFMLTSQQSFMATTLNFYGGSALGQDGANADTRLWLWNADGEILLGNDDVNGLANGDGLASLVSDPTTFSGFTGGELVNPSAVDVVLAPGMYMLSITEFSNDPDDAAGTDLVNLGADFDALHGANANAGAFSNWENAADSTDIAYTITLGGAAYCAPVPEPATFGVLGLGAAALLRRRRRSR